MNSLKYSLSPNHVIPQAYSVCTQISAQKRGLHAGSRLTQSKTKKKKKTEAQQIF